MTRAKVVAKLLQSLTLVSALIATVLTQIATEIPTSESSIASIKEECRGRRSRAKSLVKIPSSSLAVVQSLA